jgi:anti-sigma28 factor (negative regulator of flagellin synthesis)
MTIKMTPPQSGYSVSASQDCTFPTRRIESTVDANAVALMAVRIEQGTYLVSSEEIAEAIICDAAWLAELLYEQQYEIT